MAEVVPRKLYRERDRIMGNTSIEWTDKTWSPIRVRVKSNARRIAIDNGFTSLIPITEQMVDRVGPHCERVSPGCANCYAATNNRRRLPSNGTGLPYDRRSRDLVEPFVDERILLEPLKWKEPKRIFVENQSDLYGDWVTDEMIDQVEAVMALSPRHTFQVLTKRPERMGRHAFREDRYDRLLEAANRIRAERRELCGIPISNPTQFPMRNVHRGTSCEDQKAADDRIPWLLQTPAAIRFVSAEPLLGEISFKRIRMPEALFGFVDINALTADTYRHAQLVRFGGPRIDWVIVGSESGPGARPMDEDWVRGIRDECTAAGVPFFYKQKTVAGKKQPTPVLDGRTWMEFPEAKHGR
jgi:protein gp37